MRGHGRGTKFEKHENLLEFRCQILRFVFFLQPQERRINTRISCDFIRGIVNQGNSCLMYTFSAILLAITKTSRKIMEYLFGMQKSVMACQLSFTSSGAQLGIFQSGGPIHDEGAHVMTPFLHSLVLPLP